MYAPSMQAFTSAKDCRNRRIPGVRLVVTSIVIFVGCSLFPHSMLLRSVLLAYAE